MRLIILPILTLVALASLSPAQTPIPVVVPAMTPAPTKTTATATSAAATASLQATLATLQAMKAANDEILKQQAATIQRLEELEKVAQEIRIYSKRG